MSLPGPVVAIVGPTASGKSSLAERVALQLGSSVVSVDSMQVYRGMDIGTAKTPACDRRCDLLMVDVCDPLESYSVRRFQEDARACVDGLLLRGKTPVLCGGTGLYLDAVVDEMDFPRGMPGSGQRRHYEAIAEREGEGVLFALLQRRDPQSAKLIHPHNVRRVVRALELSDEGVSYAAKHEGLLRRPPHYQLQMYALIMSRSRLYRRIDRRVDAMFAEGLVDEVKTLVESGLGEDDTALQAIGYKEIAAALRGSCSMDEAREQIKVRSRHYAKRQISWLRRDGRAHWLDLDSMDEDEALEQVLQGLSGGCEATS